MDTVNTKSEGTPQAEAQRGKPFGPVAAVFLASGIGAVMLGILTTLAEANASIKDKLQLVDRVGPLSGVTVFATSAFLVAWVVLYFVLRGKDPQPKRIFLWTWDMIAVGLVMTFPIFFRAFEPG